MKISNKDCDCGAQDCSEHRPHNDNCAVYSQYPVLYPEIEKNAKNLSGAVENKINQLDNLGPFGSEGMFEARR